MGFNWKCPSCDHAQTVTNENSHRIGNTILVTELTTGPVYSVINAIACLNKECKKLSLEISLYKRAVSGHDYVPGERLQTWTHLPESSGKPQPEYIPVALRTDYQEACRIRELSPKASAALARRCLQGMIRDFCGIAKGTLNAEITALEELVAQDKAPRGVTPESVEAIDHVRKIGNIGAHMERDINLIIDIEPDEAQLLIELVETLFDEWYVARHQRAARFKGIADLRAKKDAEKNGGRSN